MMSLVISNKFHVKIKIDSFLHYLPEDAELFQFSNYLFSFILGTTYILNFAPGFKTKKMDPKMKKRKLGISDLEVSAPGLGWM
ncbi:MAG TPA: hypothetical protein VET23_05540 [Chitinophagaceae bacterium]|nr:hypothetical protein [Chitinophagaceae bacterium]